MSWRSSIRSFSRNGDSNSRSRQELIEHGRGLPCGELPEYNDISSDVSILTGEFDESSKFNGAIFSRRCMFRPDGDRPFALMFNAFVMRLQMENGKRFLILIFRHVNELVNQWKEIDEIEQ